MKNKYVVLVILATWMVVAMSYYSCSNQALADALLYRNHSDSAVYVGGEACQSCHADKFQTFAETGMGQSFGLATSEKSVGNYKNHHAVYDATVNFYYFPYFVGKDMYIKEFRLEGKDTVYQRNEKIEYIIGSGHHTNSHLIQENGYIYQAPLTFYAQAQTWDLPPGFENGKNSRFSRIIGDECMSCHNSYADFNTGSENQFIQVPHGISCERCHGPGSLHVEEKRAGKIVNTATSIDYTIVNPSKLNWERQVDVCQRCHLQGNAVLHEGKTWRSFRPGMKLNEHIDVYASEYIGGDEFIMASHAQRLQSSKCFIKSKVGEGAKLTCITCHNPHVSVKKTGKQEFNDACIKCHQTKICTEKKEVLTKNQNNCVSCHMRPSGTGDIPHVSVHDHQIGIQKVKVKSIQSPVFKGLRCVNNPSPDNPSRATAWLNAFEQSGNSRHTLDSAALYIDKIPQARRNELLVRLYYLQNKYNDIIQLQLKAQDITDGWTAYRCSEAYKAIGKYAEAEVYIYRAVSLSEKNLSFREKYTAILILNNKLDLALTELKKLIDMQPKLPIVWSNLAFIYKSKNQLDEAASAINKALALDPDYINALENKIDICRLRGDKVNMNLTIKHLLRIQPNHPVKNYIKQLNQ